MFAHSAGVTQGRRRVGCITAGCDWRVGRAAGPRGRADGPRCCAGKGRTKFFALHGVIKQPAVVLGIVRQLRGSLACTEALAVPSDRDQHLAKTIYIQSAERG
jgi:hypothetical protein